MSENLFLSPNTAPEGCPFCGAPYDIVISDIRPSFFRCKNKACPSHQEELPLSKVGSLVRKNKEIIPILVEIYGTKKKLSQKQMTINQKREELRTNKEISKHLQKSHREICELQTRLKLYRVFDKAKMKNAPFVFEDPETGDLTTVSSINTKRRAVARVGYLHYGSKIAVNKFSSRIKDLRTQIKKLKSEIAGLQGKIEHLESEKNKKVGVRIEAVLKKILGAEGL